MQDSDTTFTNALLAQDIDQLTRWMAVASADLPRVPIGVESGVCLEPPAIACASLGLDRSLAWLIEQHRRGHWLVESKGSHGNSPAVLACLAGHTDALAVWLAHAPHSVEDLDEDGDDLLDITVSRSHIGCLDVLVKAGADPTAWEDGGAASLLHLASEMSEPAMLVHLVQECGLPVDGLNGNDQTPLENLLESTLLVDEEKAPRVQALLDTGARCTFPLSKDLRRSLRNHPVTRGVFDRLQAQRRAQALGATFSKPSPSPIRPRF